MPTLGETLIPIEIPAGSSSTDVVPATKIKSISASIINGLGIGAESSVIITSVTGPVKISIFLDTIAPTNLPSTVIISNGTNSYSMTVLNTTSAKRIEFNNIPAAFAASFTVLNNLGTAFPSDNNSMLITEL